MTAPSEEQAREGLEAVCHHYLGDPRRDEGARLVYTCPGCGGTTFAANLVTLKAGCWTGRCRPGRYAGALELVSHFDGLPDQNEALERAREILGLRGIETEPPTVEGPEGADTAATTSEAEGDEPTRGEGHPSADEPLRCEPGETLLGTGGDSGVRTAGSTDFGGLARSSDGCDGEGPDEEEGWYAVLQVLDVVQKKPHSYQPAGALRPLPSSVATGPELLAAFVAFAAGAAGSWQLVGHAGALLAVVGLSEAAGVMVPYEDACALTVGSLASLAAWLFLSGRRHAERRHLGDDGPERRPGRGKG